MVGFPSFDFNIDFTAFIIRKYSECSCSCESLFRVKSARAIDWKRIKECFYKLASWIYLCSIYADWLFDFYVCCLHRISLHFSFAEEMVAGLTKVSWQRVDVSFHTSKQRFDAHSTIQVRTACLFFKTCVPRWSVTWYKLNNLFLLAACAVE